MSTPRARARRWRWPCDARRDQGPAAGRAGAYRTRINDALLTALAQSFAAWTGERSLLVDLEGHGREALVEGVDLSRTVGWFTSVFPVRLACRKAPRPGPAVPRIRGRPQGDQGAAPRRPPEGIGYGLLRYLDAGGPGRCALPAGGLVQYRRPRSASATWASCAAGAAGPDGFGPARLAGEYCGPLRRPPPGPAATCWTSTASVVEGRLRWVALQPGRPPPGDGARRWRTLLGGLTALLEHCLVAPQAGGFTPSDFPRAGLDQETVDAPGFGRPTG